MKRHQEWLSQINAYIYAYIYINTCTYIYTYADLHVYVYLFVFMYKYVCIHTGHGRVPGVDIANQTRAASHTPCTPYHISAID